VTTFDVISAPEHLPPIGTRESPMLDFKGRMDRTKQLPDYFELAKDIASMAGVYGGTLLIGAAGGSQLVKYDALDEAEANETCEAYQVAARDRCIPVPALSTDKIPKDAGFVVAVNVLPVLDRPVGVKVTPIQEDQFGSPPRAYVFPVRLSTHAIAYTPENLPMLLNPAIRRTIILLESIPAEKRANVRFVWVGWTDDRQRPKTQETNFPILGVDLERNVLLLGSGQQASIHVPLDDVDGVWAEANGQWTVRVRGAFDGMKYLPGLRS
jgi:hypothetical protein